MAATTTTTRVIPLAAASLTSAAHAPAGGRPAHWVDDKPSAFRNPWPSWRDHAVGEILKLPFTMMAQSPKIPSNIDKLLPTHTPRFSRAASASADKTQADQHRNKIQATWLGHACFFLELPRTGDAPRGIRILFDPVFSERCSPSQLVGPKRYTPAPCRVEDIPEVDAVVISHNHYDHMDTPTLTSLLARTPQPHIFAPLGNEAYFASLNARNVHTMDWWEGRRIEVDFDSTDGTSPPPPTSDAAPTSAAAPTAPDATSTTSGAAPITSSPTTPVGGTRTAGAGGEKKKTVTAAADITCTPAQHKTNRGITDSWKSLWGGWAVCTVGDSDASMSLSNTATSLGDTDPAALEVASAQLPPSPGPESESTSSPTSSKTPPPPGPKAPPPVKVWFAGDTGYRAVRPGIPLDELPSCPVFKEIGERFGGFDFAMIPIGAYLPRYFMSPVHCAPEDSVCVFRDVRARRAVGMHWGTWMLTTEDIMDPPKRLAEECEKAGIEEGAFGVCGIGETVLV